jgi:hypothetical protein
MRIVHFEKGGVLGIAADDGSGWYGLTEPGDVIITGTPGGVGVARKPPVFMQPGDVFEVEIEGMGILSNPVQEG